MPLSIAKLQDFLADKGFIPNKYFIMDGVVFYIELFSIATADIFLLYIPSKYNFSIKDENTYKIRYINMGETDTLADEYAGVPDSINIEQAYGNANIHLSPDKDHIEKDLENYYKEPITLKEISKDDVIALRSLYRQVHRLAYCVQNIKYKVGIIYKNYICAIRRDDSINCFAIKHYSREEVKKLVVIVDLETFYEKNEKLTDDIHTVKDSIYRILEKNQTVHSVVLDKIIENKKDIANIPQHTELKKQEYALMMGELETMLKTMIEAEKNILAELHGLENKNEGLQNDITKAHNRARLEAELGKINSIKAEIAKNIIILRDKRETAVLDVDKLMFDSTVMLNGIIKNFAKLKDFC
jgi:hypothetical protein